ncbi:MAG: hypothetical protein JSW61_09825, partial [Candidatus Thorarchaeota archaeon]
CVLFLLVASFVSQTAAIVSPSARDSYGRISPADVEYSVDLPWFEDSEVEGLATDGQYFYVSTAKTLFDTGDAWLYKFLQNGTFKEGIRISEGTLDHAGGIVFHEGLLWVPLSERNPTPNIASKIVRYDSNLNYFDTWQNSSERGNDHWGAVVVLPELSKVYIANWGTSRLYVYNPDATFVHLVDDPPSNNIQDWVVVENVLYGSQPGSDTSSIQVWETDDETGTDLQLVGSMRTEGASSGLTWFNGSFWSCSGIGHATLYRLVNLVLEPAEPVFPPAMVIVAALSVLGVAAIVLGILRRRR